MQPHQDQIIAGKYRLETMIAQGGMGSVWAARHVKLDARVAIKFMAPELAVSEDMRARFEREARAAAQLRSPHVVQVLDYGMEGPTPYIAMEFLEGEDLHTRLQRVGKLGLDEASRLLIQASKALKLAGQAGIVHRDLKPANLFLARSGDDTVLKVLDFGVAKALRAKLGEGTSSGMLLGSPHYMSPEQARGHDLDQRSDLFSMAVILFQMITGQRPFRGSDVGDVIVQICSDPMPVPSHLAPELPPAIDMFFQHALARDPNQRFNNAADMAQAFDDIVCAHLGLASDDPAQRRLRLGSLERVARPGPVGGLGPNRSGSFPGQGADFTPRLRSPSSETPQPPTITIATQARPRGPSPRAVISWAALALLLVGGALGYVALRDGRANRAGPPPTHAEPQLAAAANQLTQAVAAASTAASAASSAASSAATSAATLAGASASAANGDSSAVQAGAPPQGTLGAAIQQPHQPPPYTAPAPPPRSPQPPARHPVLGF